MTDILLLCLDAPLQSWGLRARWDVRDSADEPSKSAVIGMLGAALGYPVGDSRLEKLERLLRMGVRVEREGSKLVDFHTVSGVIRTAAGGAQGSPGDPYTIVSPRTYVQDAVFLVALEGPRSILEECAAALHEPRWPLYLGRKSCVPSRPVFLELTNRYADLEEVVTKYPWTCRVAGENFPMELRCVIEDESGGYLRPDRLRVNPARMYEQRAVRVSWVPFPGPPEECEQREAHSHA